MWDERAESFLTRLPGTYKRYPRFGAVFVPLVKTGFAKNCCLGFEATGQFFAKPRESSTCMEAKEGMYSPKR